MTWLYLMLGSSLLISTISILEKKILITEHAIEYSGVLSILNVFFSIPLLFFIDYSSLAFIPLLLLFFISMLSCAGFILIAKSTRHMEVSSVSPMLNLSTGVTAILSFLILGEALTTVQVLGIVMLMIGSYALQTHHENTILDPIKKIVNSKYLHFIFIAILFYAFSSLYDRFALSRYHLDPLAYLVVVHIFISFHMMVIMNVFYDGLSGIKKGLKKMRWWIVLVSILTVVDRIMNLFAIQMAYIGLIVAIKRSSSFFTILLAGELFHEKNILRKLVASVIIIAGVVLLVIK